MGFTVRAIGLVVLLVSIPGVVVWVGEVSCGNIVAEYRYRSWIGYDIRDRLLSYPELRFLSTSVFSYPELAPSQACALICLATRASSRSLHGSLTLSLPHANPLSCTWAASPTLR